MTIWSISLKAYKSLPGLGFSTCQEAGKNGFASLVMLAGKLWLITVERSKALNVEVMVNAAILRPQQLKQLSSVEMILLITAWNLRGGSFLFYVCNIPFLRL